MFSWSEISPAKDQDPGRLLLLYLWAARLQGGPRCLFHYDGPGHGRGYIVSIVLMGGWLGVRSYSQGQTVSATFNVMHHWSLRLIFCHYSCELKWAGWQWEVIWLRSITMILKLWTENKCSLIDFGFMISRFSCCFVLNVVAGMSERKPRQMLTCGLGCTVVRSLGECWVRNAGSTMSGPQTSLWPTKWRLEGYQGKSASEGMSASYQCNNKWAVIFKQTSAIEIMHLK